jgi:hypothetical protein
MKRVLLLIAAALCLVAAFTLGGNMEKSKYTLETYTGVGSGVFKHGTIVKVVDGQPVVVGHFDDDSGKDYPGTVEIKDAE